MKLKPFQEILKMSKENLDAALAPIRAHKVKTQAQLEMAKLDEKLVTLEAEIQEMCAQKEINFESLIKNKKLEWAEGLRQDPKQATVTLQVAQAYIEILQEEIDKHRTNLARFSMKF